jgi:hypothetical protein
MTTARASTSLSASVLAAFAADFAEHGQDAVALLRAESPANYLRLIVQLLPKEPPPRDPTDELSDHELVESIALLKAAIAEQRDGAAAAPVAAD